MLFAKAVGIVAGSLGGVVCFHIILYFVLWRISKRTSWKGDDDLVRLTKFPMLVLLVSVTFLLVSPFLEPHMDEISYDKTRHGVSIVLILSVGWLIMALLRFFELEFHRKIVISDLVSTMEKQKRHTKTRITPIKRLVALLVWAIVVASIILTFKRGYEIGMGILTTAGIISLLVGYSLTPVLENMVASLQIALSQPISLGDVVIVEGEWGRIEEVTGTFVVVAIWDERRLIVPLTRFTKQPFENWSRVSGNLIGTVFLYVDYSAPLEEMKHHLEFLLKGTKLWDKRVCSLQVVDCTEETMKVRCLCSASNAGNAFDLRCYVRQKMIEFLQTKHPESLPKKRIESQKFKKRHSNYSFQE